MPNATHEDVLEAITADKSIIEKARAAALDTLHELPFEDRQRDFQLYLCEHLEARTDDPGATVGEVLTVTEVQALAAIFFLTVTEAGEIIDASPKPN
jgi:hypothetical protein